MGARGLQSPFFLKLSAHQCAILDQIVLSDVARGSSPESVRATLLRRGDADVGVRPVQIALAQSSDFNRLQPMERDQERAATTLASLQASTMLGKIIMRTTSATDQKPASRRSKIAHPCAYSF